MIKNKKITTFIAVTYLFASCIFLFNILKFIDLSNITNFNYIKELCETLIQYKESNIKSFTIIFLLICTMWFMFLGVATPIAIISGFLYGPFLGLLISLIGASIGCTLLYTFAKLFFKPLIEKYLSTKIEPFINKFKKNELVYFMIFRFGGGGGIPFPIQNILPVIVDMKIKNYFLASLIGFVPLMFVINSIGNGINNAMYSSNVINIIDIIKLPEIYLPILTFILLILTSMFIKKKYL